MSITMHNITRLQINQVNMQISTCKWWS